MTQHKINVRLLVVDTFYVSNFCTECETCFWFYVPFLNLCLRNHNEVWYSGYGLLPGDGQDGV